MSQNKFTISYERENGETTTVTKVGKLTSKDLNRIFEEFILNSNLAGDEFDNQNYLYDDEWVNVYDLEDAILEEMEKGEFSDEDKA